MFLSSMADLLVIELMLLLLTASKVMVWYLLMSVVSLVLVKRSLMVLKLEYFSNACVMLSAVTVGEKRSKRVRERREKEETLRFILCAI